MQRQYSEEEVMTALREADKDGQLAALAAELTEQELAHEFFKAMIALESLRQEIERRGL